MYRCTDCKRKFRVAHECYENRGLDSPPYERYVVCPVCGGSLEEIKILEKDRKNKSDRKKV